jgi:hypothetical protein
MTTLRNPDAPTGCLYFRYPTREHLDAYIAAGWTFLGEDPFGRDGRYKVGWPQPLPAYELPPEPDSEKATIARAVSAMGGE